MEFQAYEQALKLGEKAYRHAEAKGKSPYLQVLDEILENAEVQSEEKLGVVEIPMELLVGTKTSGRKNAFAYNFMPLMKEDTEFADKWVNLYGYQTEVGNTDPIKAYEYMNKFYVQEGNKRVSVYKFLGAPSIEGEVIRIIPKKDDTLENKIYYEFLDFYKCTQINYVWFTKEGSFAELIKATGKEPGEVWTKEERDEFDVAYFEFYQKFKKMGGEELNVTAGDAFLFYMSLYPYSEIIHKSDSELKKDIQRIWSELTGLDKTTDETIVMEPEEIPEKGLLEKIIKIPKNILESKISKVAFLHDKYPENSSWSYSHELGRAHLEEVFGDDIWTNSYFLEGSGKDTAELLQEAIDDGNDIIFTANQKFLGASLKKALEYPDVKILNCSLNRSYHSVKTYYGRMYEAKFLCGMIAGAMADNDKVAYCADFPIYGAYANANAFAMGARMTNPRVKVYLHWLSDKTSDLEKIIKENDIRVVSDADMIRLSNKNWKYGLYMIEEEGNLKLTMPMWNWGKFYEKIVRDIQAGNWKRSKAVSYWWGISSDIIDLIISREVPVGVRGLVNVMRKAIFAEDYVPFCGEITAQDGTIMGQKDTAFSAEQIITMDWFVENIVGETPLFENLTEEAKTLLNLQKGLTPTISENTQ